jgi:hypothetical protein
MATYREQYLDYVKNNLSDYDYMLVVDFDLQGNSSIDGLFHSIANENWDAIFINGKTGAYGFFGLVIFTYDGLAFIDIDSDFDVLGNSYTTTLKNVLNMTCKLKNRYDLYPCKSAFNGYGLYKINSLIKYKASYIGDQLCEHSNLTKNIVQNNGKIFINPLWYGYFNIQGPGGLIDLILSS